RNFCPKCGARVFTTNLEGFPGMIFVTLGSLDNPEGIEPVLEMFTKRRLKWAKPLDLPQFENMPSLVQATYRCPQRYQSPPAWRWSNPSIASQDPIDAALVPPLKRSRDVRHTLTALPALPQLGLLFRREPCPCMPLHSHTSSSAKIRRCCVDSLNSPHKADMQTRLCYVRFGG